MAIYRESQDLEFTIGDNETVELTVNCYHGTLTNVRANNINYKCGDSKVLGGSELKGRRVKVTGSPRNPDGGSIKVEHIFKSTNTEKAYTFPGDYTGNPSYDPYNENVTYIFYVKFL